MTFKLSLFLNLKLDLTINPILPIQQDQQSSDTHVTNVDTEVGMVGGINIVI